MKYTLLLSALALVATPVVALPAAVLEHMKREGDSKMLADVEAAFAKLGRRETFEKKAVGFNAAQQYVSNQGQYAFVPPNFAAGDQRGPCPGLNAMANHGYLPHNGVATITQFITQTNKVFGMGLDIGAFLAVYGAVIDGDGLSWSIGSKPQAALFGDGLIGSHNKYESDNSPTRPDLYQPGSGNNYKLVMSQFNDLFNRQPNAATANYNLDVLTDFRDSRFRQQIASNPEFFNGPFTGVVVQPAAYTFIYRFMSNKSSAAPEGILNQEVLKSFFAITGDYPNFVWNEGQEKIPDNWYKRAIGDEYTLPYFNSDLLAAAAKYPEFLDVGGNTGKTNSFAGINFKDFTGGVYNLQNLAQGNNALCFGFQVSQQLAPDFLKSLLSDATSLLGKLGQAISSAESALGCPTLAAIDKTQLAQYPGATPY